MFANISPSLHNEMSASLSNLFSLRQSVVTAWDLYIQSLNGSIKKMEENIKQKMEHEFRTFNQKMEEYIKQMFCRPTDMWKAKLAELQERRRALHRLGEAGAGPGLREERDKTRSSQRGRAPQKRTPQKQIRNYKSRQ